MARTRNQNRANVRSERVSLVLTPAAYDGITALAQIRGVSVNDIINGVVEKLVAKNFAAIERYNSALADARDAITLDVDEDATN